MCNQRHDRYSQWYRDDRGSAVVEFALVMPLLLFFLFTIYTVGYFMNAQQIVTQATREGARQGALTNSNGQINGAIASNMSALDPLIATNPGAAATQVTITPSSETDAARTRGNPLTVSVQYTLPILFFDIAIPGIGAIPNTYKTVRSSITTTIECEPEQGESTCL